MRAHVTVPACHVGEKFIEMRVGAGGAEGFGVSAASRRAGQSTARVNTRRVAHAEIREAAAACGAVLEGGVEVVRLSAELGDDPPVLCVAGGARSDARGDAVLVEQVAERRGKFRVAALLLDDHAVKRVFAAFRVRTAGADRPVQTDGGFQLVRFRIDRALDEQFGGAVEFLGRAAAGRRDRHGAVFGDFEPRKRAVGRFGKYLCGERGAFIAGELRLGRAGTYGVDERPPDVRSLFHATTHRAGDR